MKRYDYIINYINTEQDDINGCLEKIDFLKAINVGYLEIVGGNRTIIAPVSSIQSIDVLERYIGN